MIDFILEYERRYNQCKKYQMKLPEAVLSFRLLDSANLSSKDKQLALTAASDLKFGSTKSTLKGIFKIKIVKALWMLQPQELRLKKNPLILPRDFITCELGVLLHKDNKVSAQREQPTDLVNAPNV